MKLHKLMREKEYLEIIKDIKVIVISLLSFENDDYEEGDLINFTYYKNVDRYGRLFTDKDGYEKLEVKTERVTIESKSVYVVRRINENYRTMTLERIL